MTDVVIDLQEDASKCNASALVMHLFLCFLAKEGWIFLSDEDMRELPELLTKKDFLIRQTGNAVKVCLVDKQ